MVSVLIPNSVTNIGNQAFQGCTSLTSVTIPDSVTLIGDGAFRGCTGLTSVTIGNSVSNIGDRAFWETNLDFISVASGNMYYRCEGNNVLIRNFDNGLIQGTNNSEIPNSVTSIGNYSFWGCTGLTSIIIPNSVTSIGVGAFWYCISLTSINIPNSVTIIGDSAFWYCISLTSIIIPNSVTIIDYGAFMDCPNLTIYAEVESQPAGWHWNWNPDPRPVVWGHIVNEDDVVDVRNAISLHGNFPNPFNPETTIRFTIENDKSPPNPPLQRGESKGGNHVEIYVYNVRGQRIRTLVNGYHTVGEHQITWNGTDDNGREVSSGVYFYRMITGDYVETRRMVLMK
jgi:hypothetical protein